MVLGGSYHAGGTSPVSVAADSQLRRGRGTSWLDRTECDAVVHLLRFSVTGFRSLVEVKDIPISSPTIVAGHNDSGKSALLSALGFLLGDRQIESEDCSYLADDPTSRCGSATVEGRFELDAWERNEYSLPEQLRIRRVYTSDSTVWEHWAAVPADAELRSLDQLKVPQLQELVKKYALTAKGTRRADLLEVLRQHASETASVEQWIPTPKPLVDRLPRLLSFDGLATSPDDSVRAALFARFQEHTSDTQISGRLGEIEEELKDRLRSDAKLLCDHIKRRCPDLTEIGIDPDISFRHGFQRAKLQVTRSSGGPVDLIRAGQGSSRRISLAIWEWTSELLAQNSASEPTVGNEGEPAPPPVQTIVVYDEPDTHLDYSHQRRVMDLIREQSGTSNVNVVVATHSMNLIDGVDIADVVNLKLVDGQTVVERLGRETHDDIDNFYGKIAASLGVRNSVLLHERCFLAVEGATEQKSFPLLFRLSEGMSLQSAGIALWACDNNEGALHLAHYLVSHGRRVRLLVDEDSKQQKMFKDTSLRQHFGSETNKIVHFVGGPNGEQEFEALFPDALWARVANERWPRQDRQWRPEDFTDHRTDKFSSGVLNMLKVSSEFGPIRKQEMMQIFFCFFTQCGGSSGTAPRCIPRPSRAGCALNARQ